MNDKELRSAVTRAVLTEMAGLGERWVPVATSNRHCHLIQADLERLFGPGHTLTPLRMLEQPGQFAAEEKVTLETPKGKMTLRVVGPVRRESQVELSLTDGRQLGLSPPIRLSGELDGSPGCRLSNGERTLDLARGVIAAARHLHMSAEEALAYGVVNGQEVTLRFDGIRGADVSHVIVRAGQGHRLEAHIDTDEANAFGIHSGQLCRLIIPGAVERKLPPAVQARGTMLIAPPEKAQASSEKPARKETVLDYSGKPDLLLTEELVNRAAAQGMKYIRLAYGAMVTPLARDAAWEKKIELIYPDGKQERR